MVTISKKSCDCLLTDFGNDGLCNKCGGSITCKGCGRIPCECELAYWGIDDEEYGRQFQEEKS